MICLSVQYNFHVGSPAVKLFLTFNTPWWRDVGIRNIITDLPTKQSFEMFVRPDNTSLFLAMYIIGERTMYWKSLLPDKYTDENNIGSNKLNKRLVDHALRYISEAMGVSRSDIPEPTGGAVQVWEPAVYALLPGFDWRRVRERMSRPDPSSHVYINAFGMPGDTDWTNGAIRTAEYTLNKYFGLDPY